MTLSFDLAKKEVASLVQTLLQQEGTAPSVEEVYALLVPPPEFHLGQAALPCFAFAKALRKAPAAIAAALEKGCNEAPHKKFIEKAQAVGGYLNVFFCFPQLTPHLLEEIKSSHFFAQDLLAKKEHVVVEYSQPNTHKALHVGHLRCLVLGDAVSRILAAAGHTVEKATYPGDLGTHVAKTIWYIQSRSLSLPSENKAQWLGQIYAQADTAFKENPEEAKPHIASIRKQISEKKGSSYELWKETREWSLEDMAQVYQWLGVTFDHWYFESECEEPAKHLVQEKFQEGFFVKDQGAIGIDLSAYNLGFVMFLKSDGHSLYLTKDLDLIRRKFRNPAVTQSIYVVDARQKLHFQQLFKTAELMGYPQAARSVHLSYETVNTPAGVPFSSRELNGQGLWGLKDLMEQKVKENYLERYQNEWSLEEIQSAATNVTIGALKYGMLRVDNNTSITFILDEWLRLDGDTGPYLQYAHARCQSILVKQGYQKGSCSKADPTAAQTPLTAVEEQTLAFHLWRYPEYVVHAAAQLKPAHIASYLYQLAKLFHRFYEACSIKNSPDEQTKQLRLDLVFATQQVLQKGLHLLGIPSIDKM